MGSAEIEMMIFKNVLFILNKGQCTKERWSHAIWKDLLCREKQKTNKILINQQSLSFSLTFCWSVNKGFFVMRLRLILFFKSPFGKNKHSNNQKLQLSYRKIVKIYIFKPPADMFGFNGSQNKCESKSSNMQQTVCDISEVRPPVVRQMPTVCWGDKSIIF